MSKENNHECIICGTTYHHCDDCGKIKSFTPWRTICDTREHYQIFSAVQDYLAERTTKDESKETLEYIGVTVDNISDLKDSVKEIIVKILADDTTKSTKESTVAKTTMDETTIE